MTRHFARKLHRLSFVAVFIATLILPALFAAPATAQNPVPFIDQPLVPDAAAPGAAGFTLAVNGAGFVASSTVNWNGSPLATNFISSAQLTATVPASDVATASTASVTVVSAGPGGGVSNTQYFSIAVPGTSASFLPGVLYDSGGASAMSVAIADVNGDGKPDLLVANTDGEIGVLLGNGDGTFQPVVSYSAGGAYTDSVAVADVNGDGKPDLVVANYDGGTDGNGSLAVLLGNGDGTFQPAVTYGLQGGSVLWPESVAVADVNGDGKLDLITVLYGSQVNVLLGNGDGTFQPAVSYGTGCCNKSSLTIADVNGDGKPDILIVFAFCGGCNPQDGQVGVMLNNGDGTFQPEVLYASGGDYPDSITVADVNGDGRPDLVVGNSCSNSGQGYCSGTGTVGVLVGNGDGTFQAPAIYSYPGQIYTSAVLADVNSNGIQDVLAASCPTPAPDGWSCGGFQSPDGSLEFLLGSSGGVFQPPMLFDAGGLSPVSLATADLNGDGRPDAVTAMFLATQFGSDSAVSVVLNNVGSSVIPATTTALASSLNPSIVGQNVIFTAAVSSSGGMPTGTVLFYDGSAVLGSATLASGRASFSTAPLAAGSHSITAGYQGSAAFAPSTSSQLIQVVQSASTTTSVVSSVNPAGLNKVVTYTATVASQYGDVATGSVTFQDGGATIATVAVSGNQAAYATTYSTAGVHSITATYSGDANNSGSVSSSLTEQIGEVHFRSQTTLATSESPSFVGQPLTLTATVTSIDGAIPNGELVTFYDDGTELGTGATAGGVATLATSSLSAKTHTIKAAYAGDATFERSSGMVTQVVSKYATTTVMVSSLNPSVYGQAVIWTATVTSTGPNTPTGSVRFVGSGYVRLSGGVATFTNVWLNAGTHSVTAEYEGDGASAASASSVLNQVVNPASTTTVITSSADPSTAGQNVTFTATVTSSTGAHATGTVTFREDSTLLATVPLEGTVATFSTATLGVASFAITATYNGATDFTGSQDTLIQSVEP
jgi:hypothetical protein